MQLAPFVKNSPYFCGDGRLRVPTQEILLQRVTNYNGKTVSLYENRLEMPATSDTKTVASIIADQQSVYTAYYYPNGQREPYHGWKLEDAVKYILSLFEGKQTHTTWIFNCVREGDRDVTYILDAGHRFFTLTHFLNDGFAVKGRTWSQWKIFERQDFLQIKIQVASYRNLNPSQCRELMDNVNTQLSLSKGELANTHNLEGDEWLKFSDGLFLNTIEDRLTNMFGSNDRKQHTVKLYNFGDKFRTLTIGQPTNCTGKNDYEKVRESLKQFYIDQPDSVSNKSKLINHTMKVLELFPGTHKGCIQVFDTYMFFRWAFLGMLKGEEKTKKFLEAVYNPNVKNGEWYKKWRAEEVKSGHGTEKTKTDIKYNLYTNFCDSV
jgi:hypothetical protein